MNMIGKGRRILCGLTGAAALLGGIVFTSMAAAQTTLAYNYNLTKETKLYAFATRIGNQRNAAYSFLDDTPDGAANRSIALGFRHNF